MRRVFSSDRMAPPSGRKLLTEGLQGKSDHVEEEEEGCKYESKRKAAIIRLCTHPCPHFSKKESFTSRSFDDTLMAWKPTCRKEQFKTLTKLPVSTT